MPRKKKIDVPEEELQQLDNNEISANELAEKYSTTRNYFDNIKHNRKLKTSFQLNLADQSMSQNGGLENSGLQQNQPNPDQMLQQNQSAPIMIDYHGAVKGLYQGCDAIFKLIAVMSRGQIEYTNVSDEKLEQLTTITQNDHMIQKVSTMGGISSVITIGAILGTFGGQFKMKKKIKHNENDDKCKCEKCEKVRDILEKNLKESKDAEIVQIKEVDPKEIEKGNIEKVAQKIESVLHEEPARDLNGLIIEKNIPKNISEDQVIAQNTGVKNAN